MSDAVPEEAGQPHPRPEPRCERCSVVLQPGSGDFYVVKVVAVADPAPPTFTEADVSADINRLIRQLSTQPEPSLLNQVYRRRFFHLCAACYHTWIENPFAPGPS